MFLINSGLFGFSQDSSDHAGFRQIKSGTYQDHVYGAVLGAAWSAGASGVSDRADLEMLDILTQGWQFLNQENFSYPAVAQVYDNLNKNVLFDRSMADLLLEAWPVGLVMVWPHARHDLIEKLLLLRAPANKQFDIDLCAARFAIAIGISEALCYNPTIPINISNKMILAASKYSKKIAKSMRCAQQSDCLSLLDLNGLDGVITALIHIYMKHSANLSLALEQCALIKDSETKFLVTILVGALVGASIGVSCFESTSLQLSLLEKNYLSELSQSIYQKHVARIGRYVEGFA